MTEEGETYSSSHLKAVSHQWMQSLQSLPVQLCSCSGLIWIQGDKSPEWKTLEKTWGPKGLWVHETNTVKGHPPSTPQEPAPYSQLATPISCSNGLNGVPRSNSNCIRSGPLRSVTSLVGPAGGGRTYRKYVVHNDGCKTTPMKWRRSSNNTSPKNDGVRQRCRAERLVPSTYLKTSAWRADVSDVGKPCFPYKSIHIRWRERG